MTEPRKYLPTEPPAQLTEPVTVTFSGYALVELNDFRQAQHAWLSCTGDIEEATRLREKMEALGAHLAISVDAALRHQLGEPRHYAPDEPAPN